ARALARDPARRYETARQLGTAVLDAISPVRRPWAQGEISDHVAANFADALRRRSTEVSTAVRSRASNEVVSLLDEPDDGPTEVEDTDHEFPPVDSAVTDTYPELPVGGPARELATAPARPGATRDGAPFAGNDRAIGLEALRGGAEPPPIIAVGARRGMSWAFGALAVTAVAAAAVVWVRSQQDTTRVVIESGSDGMVRKIGSDQFQVGPRPDPAPADPPAPSPVEAKPDPGTPHPASDAFTEAARRKQGDVTRCASMHGAPPPGTLVRLRIAPSGRASRLELEPQSIAGTPLGVCLKDVFRSIGFPRGAVHDLEVTISPPKQ
ncbi:MAG TPA: hypothetical protein VFK02_09585, partial [Kofleriaceae bacterium]|nr:hypothetical protein [Kofleriaceae bacterium]